MRYATHRCAEQLAVQSDDLAARMHVNADVGAHWVLSFLSSDTKKTYCLYEAPSAEAIHEAARQANLQAGAIVEVGALRLEQFVYLKTPKLAARIFPHVRWADGTPGQAAPASSEELV